MLQLYFKQLSGRKTYEEVIVYLDDIIILSKMTEDLDRLDRFLDLLRQNDLTLWRDKCNFLATKIIYLATGWVETYQSWW